MNKRLTLDEARALASEMDDARSEAMAVNEAEQQLLGTSASRLVSLWEKGVWLDGQSFTHPQVDAIVSAWLRRFGCLPPSIEDDGSEPEATSAADAAPEPADDAMLDMHDIVRMTGISESTVKRMISDGRFPKPIKLSIRRIGWPARQVKAWILTKADASGSLPH